ncbi:MAG TPA: calcium-binding protein [Thermoleophilaceae bacterium]
MRHTTLAAALALVLALPAAAAGSEVSMKRTGAPELAGPYALTFRGGSDANVVTIRPDAPFPGQRGVVIADTGSNLAAGENCRPEPPGVYCDLRGYYLERLDVDLEGGGDEADVTAGAVTSSIAGGPGDDELYGDRATFAGGPGGDLMLSRGLGVLSYADRTAGVRVTPDGVADDGEPGEGDDVRGLFRTVGGGAGADHLESAPSPEGDARVLLGLGGDDTLVGAPYRDELYGGDGRDSLAGGGGADVLWGGDGPDRMRGGDGVDAVTYIKPELAPGVQSQAGVTVTLDDRPDDGAAGEGDDVGSDVEDVTGGPGPDRLTGDARANRLDGWWGDDVLLGEAGDDEIVASDGADRVAGGPGSDRVTAAGIGSPDTLELRDGEPDFAGCSGHPRTLDADAFDFVLTCVSYAEFGRGPVLLAIPRERAPSLVVRCRSTGGSERCRGKVRLYRRGTGALLGTGRYDLPVRARRRVYVKLGAAGRSLRARARRPIPFRAYAVPERMADPTPVLGPVWPAVRGDWIPRGPRGR